MEFEEALLLKTHQSFQMCILTTHIKLQDRRIWKFLYGSVNSYQTILLVIVID